MLHLGKQSRKGAANPIGGRVNQNGLLGENLEAAKKLRQLACSCRSNTGLHTLGGYGESGKCGNRQHSRWTETDRAQPMAQASKQHMLVQQAQTSSQSPFDGQIPKCAPAKTKHYDTTGSQVISVPSTDVAQSRLTSEF
jgi:hypothetical protein